MFNITQISKPKSTGALTIVRRVLENLVLFVLLGFAFILFFSSFNNPLNLKIFTVTSGSMEPSIQTGSIVFIIPQKVYRINDIITFSSEDTSNRIVTHRLRDIITTQKEDEAQYVTKGDANEEADLSQISQKAVLGKVMLTLPYLGYPLMYAKTQMGYIFLIVVPVTIIIYSEFLSIKNEVVNIVKSKKRATKVKTIVD